MNRTMFDSALRATLAVNNNNLKRVLLQLGEKWYFRDPTPTLPQKEMDDKPVPSIAHFYDVQLSICKELAAKHSFTWTVTLPQCIYGATRQCAQTIATSLGVYIFAHRLLDLPLVFPGNAIGWNAVSDGSDAALLAEENVWASLSPNAAGQILNAVNGDVFQWKYLWPRLGAYFGAKVPSEEEMVKLMSKESGVKTVPDLATRISNEALAKAWKECKESGLGKNDKDFDVKSWEAAVPFKWVAWDGQETFGFQLSSVS